MASIDDSDPHMPYPPPWVQPVGEEPYAEAHDDAADLSGLGQRAYSLTGAAPVAGSARASAAPERARRGARPYDGDVAIRELKERLSLDPDLVPEPRRAPRSGVRRTIGRIALVLSGAAALAGGAVVLGLPALERAGWGTSQQAAPVSMTLGSVRVASIDEPVPLTIGLSRPVDGHLAIGGLPPGMRLTTGGPLAPDGWLVPVSLIGQTSVVPPRGFSGRTNLVVELRRPDDAVLARANLQLGWSEPAPPAPPVRTAAAGAVTPSATSVPSASAARPTRPGPAATAAPPIDPNEAAAMVKRAEDLVSRGDLASARLLLRRCASGNGHAALLLGMTYDPDTFSQLSVIGELPDPAKAQFWYQRAAELGSSDAARKLEALARGR